MSTDRQAPEHISTILERALADLGLPHKPRKEPGPGQGSGPPQKPGTGQPRAPEGHS